MIIIKTRSSCISKTDIAFVYSKTKPQIMSGCLINARKGWFDIQYQNVRYTITLRNRPIPLYVVPFYMKTLTKLK